MFARVLCVYYFCLVFVATLQFFSPSFHCWCDALTLRCVDFNVIRSVIFQSVLSGIADIFCFLITPMRAWSGHWRVHGRVDGCSLGLCFWSAGCDFGKLFGMLLLKFGSSVVLLIGFSSAWTFIVSFNFVLSVFVFVSPATQAYGDASRAAQAVTNAKVARTSSRREV